MEKKNLRNYEDVTTEEIVNFLKENYSGIEAQLAEKGLIEYARIKNCETHCIELEIVFGEEGYKYVKENEEEQIFYSRIDREKEYYEIEHIICNDRVEEQIKELRINNANNYIPGIDIHPDDIKAKKVYWFYENKIYWGTARLVYDSFEEKKYISIDDDIYHETSHFITEDDIEADETIEEIFDEIPDNLDEF